MKAVLIPQTIFVGDTAQFLVPLSDQEAYALKIHNVPAEKSLLCTAIAENQAMTIQDVRITVRDTQSYLLISFIPWETGTVYFPSFSFLYIERELPAITVASMLDTTSMNHLQPTKQPLIMPGTDYLLYSAAGIAFVGAVAAVALSVYLYRFFKKRRSRGYEKKRRKYLKKNMKKLQKTARKIEKKLSKPAKTAEIHRDLDEWYKTIDTVLRQYFFLLVEDYSVQTAAVERTRAEAFFSATYTELAAILQVFYNGQTELRHDFFALCKRLEYNRFGRRIASPLEISIRDCDYMINAVPSFADKTEQQYAAAICEQKTGTVYA